MDLSLGDFKVKRSHKIRCSKSHSEFRFKDYCPAVFRSILALQNIEYHEYFQAICVEELFAHVVSTARYGSTFVSSVDDRFFIKFTKKRDLKVMIEMLPSYYRHLKTYRASLLVKLFGLHVIEPAGGLKAYVVVMSNVMRVEDHILRSYDLKGTIKGRRHLKLTLENDALLKDADFEYCFYVDPLVRYRLLKQIKYDCKFLEAEGIMDYSLLLGIQRKSPYGGFLRCPKSSNPISGCSGRNSDIREDTNAGTSQVHRTRLSLSSLCAKSDSEIFGLKMLARAVRTHKDEVGVTYPVRSPVAELHDVFLYFGIVDFFQTYNMKKRIEHIYKSIQYDSKSIAAVNPRVYSSRFQDFVSRVFQSDGSESSNPKQ